MHVRIANKADAHIIQQFQVAMALETEHLVLDEEVVRNGIEAVFNDPLKGKYYVTENNGTVIASLLLTYEWSDWRNGTVIWLQSVYVMKEFRKRGIFTMMYQYIQDLAKNDTGIKGIRLYVDTGNKTAQSIYKQLGMNTEHYRLYEWLKD